MQETEVKFNQRNADHTKLEVRYRQMLSEINVLGAAQDKASEVIDLATSIAYGSDVLLEIAEKRRLPKQKLEQVPA